MNKEKLLELYKPYTSVLGPYTRKDGRKHIVLNNSFAPKGAIAKTKTISYPKALMESTLGRRLTSNEEVDHKDNNKLNDASNNHQILTKTENRIKQQEAIYGKAIKHYCICGNETRTTYSKTGGRVIKFCSPECRKNNLKSVAARCPDSSSGAPT